MREQDEGYAIPSGETRQSDHPPVVLVDDESAFADALAFRLEARGIPVRVYYRGGKAPPLPDIPPPEPVLPDLQMPRPLEFEAPSPIEAPPPAAAGERRQGTAAVTVAAT